METSVRTSGRQRDPNTDVALIEAVLDLVSSGATLSGLSLVEIAKHAGVSRNSLYRRWKTKDALYLDVLDAINRPLPPIEGKCAFDDVAEHLAVVIERTIDKRASRMLVALAAEADVFPDLYRRYFDEIVAPRRAALHEALCKGIASGEIDNDVDVVFAAEVLVGPVLARLITGATDDLDPTETGRRITESSFPASVLAEALAGLGQASLRAPRAGNVNATG